MKTYTVVLLYPDYLTNDYGADLFVWTARAETPQEAVVIAQHEAMKSNADTADETFNFKMILLLEGEPKILGDATGIYKMERTAR